LSWILLPGKDAISAGYPSQSELISELNKRHDGNIYLIEFGSLKNDPRIALRQSPATEKELDELKIKLQKMDSRTNTPWTPEVLQLLKSHPVIRAGDLCVLINQEKMDFKRNVRKLKNLGLTESLGTGYCLSPRGEAYLESLA